MSNIQRRLKRCERCGVFRGSVQAKAFNWKGTIYEDEYSYSEDCIDVYCLCESTALCSKCKRNKIFKSMSWDYNETDNTLWHRPCFASLVPCKKCRTKNGKIKDTCSGQT